MPEAPQQSSLKAKSHGVDWKSSIIGILIGGILVGLGLYGYFHYQVKSDRISTKKDKASAKVEKSEKWRAHKDTENKYLLKSPESWYESTDTKTVNEENNIVYHFYSVSREKDQTQGI